jgi:hypothetical protein
MSKDSHGYKCFYEDSILQNCHMRGKLISVLVALLYCTVQSATNNGLSFVLCCQSCTLRVHKVAGIVT